MSDLKGKILVRHVNTDSELPKGKKMVVIIGVAIVDEDFQESSEYKIDGQLNDTGMNLVAIKSKNKPKSNFDGWAANDVLDEYPWGVGKPETSRLASFMEPASKALKMISNSYFSPIPLEQAENFLKVLSKQHKTLPIFDSMKQVFESIMGTLKDKKIKK